MIAGDLGDLHLTKPVTTIDLGDLHPTKPVTTT